MRHLITILLSLSCVCANAQTNKAIYISSSTGNDANNGLDSNHAYKSLTKLNAVFGSLAAGDTVKFKRGDTFLGQFFPARSGIAGRPMIIMDYSAGAKPLISGLITLHTWTLVSGNIWQCTPDSALKANTNVLTFNGAPQAVAHGPWMTYQSATTTQLTSSSLTGTPSYVGAEIVTRKGVFLLEKGTITAQSGSTVTVANNTQPIENNRLQGFSAGKSGYGFFIQRFPGLLDQQGEYYFDKSANKVQIYSITNPNSATIKISFKDTLLRMDSRGYVTIQNLAFEGAGIYAIESYSGTSVTVRNCDFNNNTKGVYEWNTTDIIIESNYLNNSLQGAITASNKQAKRLDINYNTILNTGQLIGNAEYNNENSMRGIHAETDSTTANNFLHIIGNKIINSGSAAINWQGSNAIIRKNITDTFANQIDDMGGIYIFTNNQSTNNVFYSNRIVDSNFVSNAIGVYAVQGKPNDNIDVAGLYFDDQDCNIIVRHNTVWNVPGNGLQLNNPLNFTVQDNTIYNCTYTINENRKHIGVISGILISKNILYQKTAAQYNFYHVTDSLNRPTTLTATQAVQQLGTIDSNWMNNNLKANGWRTILSGTVTEFPLSTWRSSYGHDVNAILPSVATTSSNTRIVTNPSDTVLIAPFQGQRKIDAKNSSYDNFINVPKWSSVILIDNGTANIPPVSNAGADKSITLPLDSVTVTGSGTDADGTIGMYVWTKISGPSTYFVVTPGAATTKIRSLQVGVYKFSLTVTDNGGSSNADTMQITVIANTPPSANSGTDKLITLPVNSVSLTGTGTDADGIINSYAWSQISGPNSGTFGTASAATTTFNSLIAGTYQVKFTVTDNGSLTASDTVQVTVLSNPAPVANAGADSVITLPVNNVHLIGSGTDDISISSYAWTKISGPNTPTIVSASSASTNVTGTIAGVYQFKLTVTDNGGATGVDTVLVTVNPAPNQAPTSNAGADAAITLPTNSTTVTGSGADADGTISTYAWIQISGPNTATFGSAGSATTTVNGLIQGVYKLRLTVTDNNGATGFDEMDLTVNGAANLTPSANAGVDSVITLPVNTCHLIGSGNDPDGSISSYAWTKISGPAGGTISNSAIASPTLSVLQQGVYVYQLMVTDNLGATASNQVTITVNPNPAPTVNAGIDQIKTLPVNSASVTAIGTDDISISSYAWIKLPGSPTGGTIASPSAATTAITALIQGVYQFEATVMDNGGATGKDTIKITVLPNPAPVANAGTDSVITLPISTCHLLGSGTDDISISSYSWVKISGPSGGTISNSAIANPVLSALQFGVYQFELTVMDNGGATGKDTVSIIVNLAPNVLPQANASIDRSITPPRDTITIFGGGTDSDGSISSYSWAKILGPSLIINSPNSATTIISSLVSGTYQLELTVTDDRGGVSKDTMQLIVNTQPFNLPPLADAGPDRTIYAPRDTITIFGHGSDADGTITYYWSGTGGTVADRTLPSIVVSGLTPGAYTFALLVRDDGNLTAIDDMTLTVVAAPTGQKRVILGKIFKKQ